MGGLIGLLQKMKPAVNLRLLVSRESATLKLCLLCNVLCISLVYTLTITK